MQKEILTFQRGGNQQAKGLADAWIKVDKVNECKAALQGRSIFVLGLPTGVPTSFSSSTASPRVRTHIYT